MFTYRQKGFTLIEVLVVVAIIALLVSILLPSLSRAREQARLVQDMANMKEIGKALPMYLLENRDILPGPFHPALLRQRTKFSDKQQNFYMPNVLRKYFSETSRSRNANSVADKIATCPSFPIPDSAFKDPSGRDMDPYHYVIQTGEWTKTPYYFGFTHGGIEDYQEWKEVYGNTSDRLRKYSPKNISVVRQPAREWLIADAFERPWRSGEYPGQFPGLARGSWSIEAGNDANSGFPLPKSPFHLGSGYERKSPVSLYKGKATTLFADWHVEAANWRGTILENRGLSY